MIHQQLQVQRLTGKDALAQEAIVLAEVLLRRAQSASKPGVRESAPIVREAGLYPTLRRVGYKPVGPQRAENLSLSSLMVIDSQSLPRIMVPWRWPPSGVR